MKGEYCCKTCNSVDGILWRAESEAEEIRCEVLFYDILDQHVRKYRFMSKKKKKLNLQKPLSEEENELFVFYDSLPDPLPEFLKATAKKEKEKLESSRSSLGDASPVDESSLNDISCCMDTSESNTTSTSITTTTPPVQSTNNSQSKQKKSKKKRGKKLKHKIDINEVKEKTKVEVEDKEAKRKMEMDEIRPVLLKKFRLDDDVEKEHKVDIGFLPKKIISPTWKNELESQRIEKERRRAEYEKRSQDIARGEKERAKKEKRQAKKAKNRDDSYQEVLESQVSPLWLTEKSVKNESSEHFGDVSQSSSNTSCASVNSGNASGIWDAVPTLPRTEKKGYADKHLDAFWKLLEEQPKRHTLQQQQEERKRAREVAVQQQNEELKKLRLDNKVQAEQETNNPDRKQILLKRLRDKERQRNMEEDQELQKKNKKPEMKSQSSSSGPVHNPNAWARGSPVVRADTKHLVPGSKEEEEAMYKFALELSKKCSPDDPIKKGQQVQGSTAVNACTPLPTPKYASALQSKPQNASAPVSTFQRQTKVDRSRASSPMDYRSQPPPTPILSMPPLLAPQRPHEGHSSFSRPPYVQRQPLQGYNSFLRPPPQPLMRNNLCRPPSYVVPPPMFAPQRMWMPRGQNVIDRPPSCVEQPMRGAQNNIQLGRPRLSFGSGHIRFQLPPNNPERLRMPFQPISMNHKQQEEQSSQFHCRTYDASDAASVHKLRQDVASHNADKNNLENDVDMPDDSCRDIERDLDDKENQAKKEAKSESEEKSSSQLCKGKTDVIEDNVPDTWEELLSDTEPDTNPPPLSSTPLPIRQTRLTNIPTLPSVSRVSSVSTVSSIRTLPTVSSESRSSIPTLPSVPIESSIPTPSSVPIASSIPTPSTVPIARSIPTPSGVPIASSIPTPSSVPIVSNIPTLPNVPIASSIPTLFTVPTVPSIPTLPTVPTLSAPNTIPPGLTPNVTSTNGGPLNPDFNAMALSLQMQQQQLLMMSMDLQNKIALFAKASMNGVPANVPPSMTAPGGPPVNNNSSSTLSAQTIGFFGTSSNMATPVNSFSNTLPFVGGPVSNTSLPEIGTFNSGSNTAQNQTKELSEPELEKLLEKLKLGGNLKKTAGTGKQHSKPEQSTQLNENDKKQLSDRELENLLKKIHIPESEKEDWENGVSSVDTKLKPNPSSFFTSGEREIQTNASLPMSQDMKRPHAVKSSGGLGSLTDIKSKPSWLAAPKYPPSNTEKFKTLRQPRTAGLCVSQASSNSNVVRFSTTASETLNSHRQGVGRGRGRGRAKNTDSEAPKVGFPVQQANDRGMDSLPGPDSLVRRRMPSQTQRGDLNRRPDNPSALIKAAMSGLKLNTEETKVSRGRGRGLRQTSDASMPSRFNTIKQLRLV